MRTACLAIAVALIMASCTSTPTQYSATTEDPYGDAAIRMTLTSVDRLFGNPKGIYAELKNLTQQPVTVVWNRSSIDDNSGSHPVFLAGMKYIDAGRGVPDRLIPAGSFISAGVYPADRVSFVGSKWVMLGLYDGPISLTLCVLVGGQERFYTLRTDTTKPLPQ